MPIRLLLDLISLISHLILEKMYQNLSSAVVVIGALRVTAENSETTVITERCVRVCAHDATNIKDHV